MSGKYVLKVKPPLDKKLSDTISSSGGSCTDPYYGRSHTTIDYFINKHTSHLFSIALHTVSSHFTYYSATKMPPKIDLEQYKDEILTWLEKDILYYGILSKIFNTWSY